MLNAARLREVLDYDASTGLFVWKTKTCRKVVVGTVAGSIEEAGYVVIGVDGKTYRAQRLAVLWMTGEWPHRRVDHRDQNRQNNSWLNLRPATAVENGHNQKRSARNSSGFAGVSRHSSGKWRAQISINRQHRSLGLYDTAEAASAAYLMAKQEVFSC